MPQIALRRHQDGTLDDTVVTGVKMFRAEVLHDDCLWLCCYLDNGERITWTVRSHEYEVQEMPPEGTYTDFDKARREARSVGEDDALAEVKRLRAEVQLAEARADRAERNAIDWGHRLERAEEKR